MSVKQNGEAIQAEIDKLCARCGRDPNEINIVAVTKYVSVQTAQEALTAGFVHIGENRAEGLGEKWDSLQGEAVWHFIGSLQSKKVKKVIGKIDYLHSLDRISLAKELDKRLEHGKQLKCFVQVNVSGEESKAGLAPAGDVGLGQGRAEGVEIPHAGLGQGVHGRAGVVEPEGQEAAQGLGGDGGLEGGPAAGEALGVIGPSGGGKSTMMMVIAGLEKITSGAVRTAGVDLNGLSEDDLARFRRDHVGVVFQDFHLIPTMTALENVAVPLEFGGADDAFDRARAGLRAVGLEHRLQHYPGQLSGGEQQRVALARAFSPEPSILLADEPTGNLDGDTGGQVMDILFDLHDRSGTTLLLISHDMQLAHRCGRIVRLADGRIDAASEGAEI